MSIKISVRPRYDCGLELAHSLPNILAKVTKSFYGYYKGEIIVISRTGVVQSGKEQVVRLDNILGRVEKWHKLKEEGLWASV